MTVYQLMRNYARDQGVPLDPDMPNPELGNSLSLFHASLLESGLETEGPEEKSRIIDTPSEIESSHLSHFIVAFLPFNSVTKTSETNTVLFEVYSFFRWLDKNKISHGLVGIDIMDLVKDFSSMQERCLKLSQLLDGESGRVLDDPPEIVHTVTDVFSVVKIENDRVLLKGRRQSDVFRLGLPANILPLIKLKDNLDLVLGDTSERWVLLEAGQVYPAYSP